MCLVTKNKEGLVSDKPIVCYKLYDKDKEDGFVSPFQGTCYNLKEGDEVVAEEPEEIRESPNRGYYELGHGFIHATTERWMPVFVSREMRHLIHTILENVLSLNLDEQDIDDELEETIKFLAQYYRLCEMEIPAGERYWMEVDMELLQKGICSNKMIFKREYKITKKSELLSIANRMVLSKTKIQTLIEKYKEKGE